MKVVINVQHGGFGLSDQAYEKLIEWGVPVRKYVKQQRDPRTGLYEKVPENDGEIIFDRTLTPPDEYDRMDELWKQARDGGSLLFGARYWDAWADDARSHPLIVRVVEELGDKASGACASLKVVDIPDDVEYEIGEYDGAEWVAERHRRWS